MRALSRGATGAGMLLVLTLPVSLCVQATESKMHHDASTTEATTVSLRYQLMSSSTEPSRQSGRYTLRARFAAAESAGELREGAHFSLIGRFAKAGVSCNAAALFSNGFE